MAPTLQTEKKTIPYHPKKRFEAKIEKITNQRIVEDHEGPSPWVSNPVQAPKHDVDISTIPWVEDIKSCLAGCRLFSKLDSHQAFHQLELDKESRKNTVFYANRRLVRHCVLPRGLKPASGELTNH